MCTAQGLAAFDVGATGGLSLLNVYGAYSTAQINQEVASKNAQFAETQAADALNRGAQEEMRLRRKGARFRGSQKARLAAGNVDVDTGSALDILEATDRGIEEDAAAIRTNAGREAYARKVEGAGYRAQAAGISPSAVGTTSLLTGASAVADKWYRYDQDYGD